MITFSIDLEIVHCANCGVPFGITRDYEQRRREDHGSFFCPAGHSNVFKGKTDAERLREQLQRKEQDLAAEVERRRRAEAAVQAEQFKTRAERAAKTKLKNRVGHGVCPCCKRSFENLRRHMASKHPEFTAPEKK